MQGLRKEQAEALIEQISGNEAITSNTILTKEQTAAILEQAEARKLLSVQQKENIAQDLEESASSIKEASAEMAQTSAKFAESGAKLGSVSSILSRGLSQFGTGLKSILSIFVSSPIKLIVTLTGSIVGLTYVIGKFQNNAQNAAKAASNFSSSMASITSTYNQEISTLSELTDKYSDLRQQLIAAKGNEEETYNIKSQILELQGQLNEIYGDECEKVNLVTNAYKDQTAELKNNSRAKSQNYLNENYDKIKEATEKMTSVYEYELGSFQYGLNVDAYLGKDLSDQIHKIAEENGIEWSKDEGFIFKGTAKEAHDAINQFMSDITELKDAQKNLPEPLNDSFSNFLSGISKQLGYTNDIINGYQETYEAAQMAQIASNSKLSNEYNEAVSAVENYNKAVLESENPYDDENVKNAWNNLQTIKNGIQDNENEWGQYSNIINKVFDSASDDTYSFYQAMQNDEAISDLVSDLKGLSDVDLKSMADDEVDDSFDKLCEKAEEYGLDIQEVIDFLVELGIVQGKIVSETEDLNNVPSFTTLISQVQTLTDGLDQLDAVYADVLNKEDFDWSSILNNTNFKEAFAEMQNIPQGYETAYDDFIKTVTNNTDDIDACQEAFNRLATAYIYSKGYMKDLTDETKDATIAFLKQKGVANAEEFVENNLALAKRKLADAEEVLSTAKEKGIVVSENLENVTRSEIATLLAFGDCSKEARSYLFGLAAAKMDLNNNPINNKADVDAIVGIANAANKSEEYVNALRTALENLQNAQNRVANAKKVKGQGAVGAAANAMASMSVEGIAQSQVDKYMEDLQAGLTSASLDASDFYADFTGGSKSKSAKDGSSSEKDSKKTFDWIEKALTRIKEAYDRLNKVVSATYRSWSTRNNALAQEIGNIRDQIALNQKAYEGYMAQANSVGLSDYYKTLVQNGAISIEDITDKDLQEQIENYQTWYEKAIACSDAIAELQNNLADLAKTQFDNTAKQFDERISLIEHETDMLNGTITIIENRGYLASAKLYDSLIQNESKKLSELQSKYASLSNEIKGIEEGTEMWYDMYEQILSVEKEIQDSTNSLVEFNNKIRELQWDVFDKLQERMSAVTDEAEFFIDLMSNNKLFTDEGITDFGRATFGLHAVNLNTYMAQADEYAKELKQINEDLADDPNNWTLLERRKELIEAQRSMIKNAEDEKQSIKDLVSDGYDVMLDALQKLVDKQKDLLDSQKDLYNYQKNIEQQTKNIASLEKQLGAYSGDTSEETQAKIQQIKVDLESARQDLQETEYERFISDQQQMYDSMMDSAESWVSELLDDLDALINDVISNVNDDSKIIKDTLTEEATRVGTTLSDEMESIWSPNGTFTSVVTTYANGFDNKMTTVSETLNGIKDLIASMVKDAEEKANEQHAKDTSAGGTTPSTPAPSTPGTNAGSSGSGSNGTGSSNGSGGAGGSNGDWGSWFIYKKDNYSKSSLHTENSIVDKILSTLNTLNCGETLRDLTTKHIFERNMWRLVTESVW